MKPQARVSIPINTKPELTKHIKHVLAEAFPQIDIFYEFSDDSFPIALSIEVRQNNLGCVEINGNRDASAPFEITIEEIHIMANKTYRDFIRK